VLDKRENIVNLDSQPEMIGRDLELKQLQSYLDKAVEGKGNMVFISGEAGIGKTRLINELKPIAQSKGFQILWGNSIHESLTSYMPLIEALRSGNLEFLFAEEAPRIETVYLVTHSGLLIKEVMRKETKLHPDIFAAMLTTVANFVKESMSMLSGEDKEVALNTLGYEEYRIIIESGQDMNLVAVLTGRENEFLISDMKEILKEVEAKYGSDLKDWDGDENKSEGIEKYFQGLITSGKYDGIYYGKEDPKVRRNLLFENVSMGLARQAEKKPALLCIEDLHWADPSSLALMHYIARNTREYGLLILGTFRPEDVPKEDGKVHPLIDTMHKMDREDLFQRMDLQRLSRQKISHFLWSLLGKVDFEDVFIDRIYKESEGNPLFMIQLVRFLIEENIIKSENGTLRLARNLEDVGIPSKIQTVIARRLGKVEKEHRRILDYASVVGEIFNSRILASAMDVQKIQVLERLRVLEQNYRLIHSYNGNHKFDHAMIKEVLYNEIPGELREEYHAIIAHSIEDLNKDNLDDVIGDLAFHYYRCKKREKALHYLRKAAEKAKKEYSNEEAIRSYDQALELEENDEERIQLFESLGDIYALIGEYTKSIDSYNNALSLATEKRRRAGLSAKIGGVLEKKGEYNESVRICTDALDKVKGEGCKEEANAQRIIGVCNWRIGMYDEALKNLESSMEIQKKLGDQANVITCLNDIGRVYKVRTDYDHAIESYNKALEISQEIDNMAGTAISLKNIGTIHHMRGYLNKGIEYYRKSLKMEEKIGNQSAISLCHYNIANAYGIMGEWEKGFEPVEKSLKISNRIGDQEGIARAYGVLGKLYGLKGDEDLFLEYKIKCIEIMERLGLKELLTYQYGSFMQYYLKKGDLERAVEYQKIVIDIYDELGLNQLQADSQVFYGLLYGEKKMWKEAIDHYNRALKYNLESGTKLSEAGIHFQLGVVYKKKGDSEEAKKHFNRAFEVYDELNLERGKEKMLKELKGL
jgi:predicted ATPase/predicted regulator of Ras-like GTPase activity (Roadblock/LC7/MglB family)